MEEFQQHQPEFTGEMEEEIYADIQKSKLLKKKKNSKKNNKNKTKEEEEHEEVEGGEEHEEVEEEEEEEEQEEEDELEDKANKYENGITKILNAQKIVNKRKATKPHKLIQAKIQKKGDELVYTTELEDEEKKSVVKVRKPATPLTLSEKKRKHYRDNCMAYYDYLIDCNQTPQIYLQL